MPISLILLIFILPLIGIALLRTAKGRRLRRSTGPAVGRLMRAELRRAIMRRRLHRRAVLHRVLHAPP